MRVRFVALVFCLAVTAVGSAWAERVTVQLKDGSSLTGELLAEQPSRLVMDIGFRILEVPKARVARVVRENADEEADAGASERHGIFETAGRRTVLSVQDNIDRVGQSVVLIKTPTALGSGFLIHADGNVVTNHHVIAGDRKLTVTVFDERGSELVRHELDDVRIVATDPHGDLALLKIEDAGDAPLSALPLAASDGLESGQTVFAIGSPLGLERTVSEGIVSQRNRPLDGHLYIQTTVQLNPGNSGGPLFNLRGEVVGVNNRKIGAVGVEGLAFAIPVDRLKSFLTNRDAFAFDERNPNNGFRYNEPPQPAPKTPTQEPPR